MATPPTTTAVKPAARKAPAKTATKTAAKPAAKSAARKPVAAKPAARATPRAAAAKPAVAAAAVAAVARPEKPKKPKLVRDSFTIPKLEYAVIDDLKTRSAKLGRSIKKSELLRAGLKALAAMTDADLQKALQAVPTIKTGRPKG